MVLDYNQRKKLEVYYDVSRILRMLHPWLSILDMVSQQQKPIRGQVLTC